jgi:nicotinate-nucleotide pyrophosphorylase
MNLDEIKELVKLNNKKKKLAVKGNITLTKVRSYALTGVDYIYIDILNNYKNLEIDFRFYKRLKK